MTAVRLPEEIRPVLENGIPVWLATCSASGAPNVSIVSQVYWVDDQHVALSFQFFNKTVRNVRENPAAVAIVHEMDGPARWHLGLEFVRSESKGAIFDEMAIQIEAIASASGMSGIFCLRAADIYRVRSCRRLPAGP